MSEHEQRALAALRFNWAWTPDDVWGDSPFHVEGMHVEVEREVLSGLHDAQAERKGSPIGLVLRGQRGAGKTHLLGWVRRQVQREAGYFFLVDLDQATISGPVCSCRCGGTCCAPTRTARPSWPRCCAGWSCWPGCRPPPTPSQRPRRTSTGW